MIKANCRNARKNKIPIRIRHIFGFFRNLHTSFFFPCRSKSKNSRKLTYMKHPKINNSRKLVSPKYPKFENSRKLVFTKYARRHLQKLVSAKNYHKVFLGFFKHISSNNYNDFLILYSLSYKGEKNSKNILARENCFSVQDIIFNQAKLLFVFYWLKGSPLGRFRGNPRLRGNLVGNQILI